ncbi:MAG: hypothetical protein ACE366_04640 [Bradymonadia bacterium]
MQTLPNHAVPAHDRLVVSISDFELGDGSLLDDFPQSEWAAELLTTWARPPYLDTPVDLVLNGDTFDCSKTPLDGWHPHLVDEQIALAKLKRIANAHKPFFEALSIFLTAGSAPRNVYFITGNHDFELSFPAVHAEIRRLCGGGEGVHFPGFELRLGPIFFEHGAQHDPMFQIDAEAPLLDYKGRSILNLPWGTVSIAQAVMAYQPDFCHLDRIKPKPILLERVPECKTWLATAFKRYWTRHYLKDLVLARDPLKTLSWPMLKELLKRFTSMNPDVQLDLGAHAWLHDATRPQVTVVAHTHEPGLWTYADRRVVQTGCMRNEYIIGEGDTLHLCPKSFATLYVDDDRVTGVQMHELQGPPLPEGYIPQPLSAFRETFRDLLKAFD